MRLSVQHTTTYHYSAPVADSINDAHLCPTSDELQRCETFDLAVDPPTGNILRRLDFFTNQVHHIEVHEPHESLSLSAKSLVETLPDHRDTASPVPADSLAGLKQSERFYDFLAESKRVSLGPDVIHTVEHDLPPLREVDQGIRAILSYIDGGFTYRPGQTSVETSVSEVLHKRTGVCQDFAHVMLSLCRASGIPARYVSGYFHVAKPTSDPADDNHQSHAWVECYLPEIGWVGYDPTHHRRVGETYVKVAVGRDYTDVRPVAGTFRGKAEATMEVRVKVERVD